MTDLTQAEKQLFDDLKIDVSSLPLDVIMELYPEKTFYNLLRPSMNHWVYEVEPLTSRLILLVSSYLEQLFIANPLGSHENLEALSKMGLLISDSDEYAELVRMSEQGESYDTSGLELGITFANNGNTLQAGPSRIDNGVAAIPCKGGDLNQLNQGFEAPLYILGGDIEDYVAVSNHEKKYDAGKASNFALLIINGALWSLTLPHVALEDEFEDVEEFCLPAVPQAMMLIHRLEEAMGLPLSEHKPFPAL